MFVPYTRDPYKKLGQANNMLEVERPVPAELLIRQSIEIFSNSGDQAGVAEAYSCYGAFFRSNSVEKWARNYKKSGFFDKTANFDTRYSKSLDYFIKSKDIWKRLDVPDRLANAYLNIGIGYVLIGNMALACDSYTLAIESHLENRRRNPASKQIVPSGYASFEEYVMELMRDIKCDSLRAQP